MAKQLVFEQEARNGLKAGIDILAQAVMTTLGPKGRNVAIDKKWGAPTITHDGVSVAKEIELEDPYQNMGAQLSERSGDQDERHCGRWDDDGDGAGVLHGDGRLAQSGGGGQPDAAEAWH